MALTITRKIVLGFVVLLVLMGVSGVFATYALFTMNSQMTAQRERQEKLTTAANNLKVDVNAEVDGVRAELLARSMGGGALVDPGTLARATKSDLTKLQAVLPGGATEKKFKDLTALLTQFGKAKDQVLVLARGDRVKQATDMAERQLNPLSILMGRSLDEVLAGVTSQIQDQQASLDSRTRTMGIVAAAAVAAAIVAGIVLAIVISRDVARRLKHVIKRLSTSTAEMLAVTSQVAAGAVQTATAISEAATTVDEVRQTSLLSSQKATTVSDSAQTADQVAEAGRRAVSETLEGIQRIQDQMTVVADSVVKLSEQNEAVGEIISTSNDLAEQSNLLSVNAAIEAAKASDQGKGFSVVAEEIKNLAMQSKQGVVQVRSILNDIQQATAAAVMAAEQSSKAIAQGARQATESSAAIESLAESVAAAAQSAMQIVASSQQQLVGMDQISEAMSSIDQASAQNAAGARQMEVEVQHLQELASAMRAMVEPNFVPAT
jgi:methyl-accepting chemotaxis protein